MGWVALFLVLVLLIGWAWKAQVSEEQKVASMSPEARAEYQQKQADYWRGRELAHQEQKAFSEHGPLNPWQFCPHCQTKGTVRTKQVKKKKGISGAKATAALMTGGVSMFATGLSQKEKVTQAHCENCGAGWLF